MTILNKTGQLGRLNLGLIGIVFIATLLRTAWLDRIPGGIVNDELDYITNAKSVYYSGSDISRTWNPLSLTPPKSGFPQAEIVPILTAPFIGPLPFSPLYSKLPYVAWSVWLVFLVYAVTKKIAGQWPAYFAGISAALSPWMIFFGRTAYDTPVAVAALMSGLYVLLITEGWNILWAFPLFAAGFYSYIGAKVLLIPFALVAIVYAWRVVSGQKYTLQYALLSVLCLGLVAGYGLSIRSNAGSRTGELATPFTAEIATKTDEARKNSIHTPLTPLFINKFTVYGKEAIGTYIGAFSGDFLFLHGDPKAQFTTREHGVLYLVDAAFLLIGLSALYAKQRRAFILVAALIAIAPVPSIASTVGVSYAIRSFLLAPVFAIAIGVGIHEILGLSKVRNVVFAVIVLAYGVSLAGFINVYALRNPIYNSESFAFSGRILAKYLSLTTAPVVVVNGDPRVPFKQLLFYTNAFNRTNAGSIAGQFRTGEYRYGNVRFITCEQARTVAVGSTVVYDDPKCPYLPTQNAAPDIIGRLNDGGMILAVANDAVCGEFALRRYPEHIGISDFAVESMPRQRFCETFITRY